MGRASRVKREATRQQKIAAQRAAARRAQVRDRLLLSGGAVIAVVAVVVAFVVVKVSTGPRAAAAGGAGNGPAGAALATVVAEVTGVPAATLNAVGAGSGVTGTPQPITGPLLTKDGKPEVLYIGAEYCPFCAAERWAAIVALSRFGSFCGLRTVRSSSTDVHLRQVRLHQQVPDLHPGGDLHQRPLRQLLHAAAEAHRGRAGADEHVRRPAVRARPGLHPHRQPASACTPAVRTVEKKLEKNR